MNELLGALKPLGLLETVAAMPHPATLAELAVSVGVPKPTMHRWLGALEAAGLLQRTLDGRRFELAPRASRLAFSILGNQPGGTLRREILQQVVQEVGEACNLTVLDGTQVTYLDRVEAEWLLRISFQQGSKVPAYCSASGKLFLALMRPAKRDLLLRLMPLQRLTDNTITEKERPAQGTHRNPPEEVCARPRGVPVRARLPRSPRLSAKGEVARLCRRARDPGAGYANVARQPFDQTPSPAARR